MEHLREAEWWPLLKEFLQQNTHAEYLRWDDLQQLACKWINDADVGLRFNDMVFYDHMARMRLDLLKDPRRITLLQLPPLPALPRC